MVPATPIPPSSRPFGGYPATLHTSLQRPPPTHTPHNHTPGGGGELSQRFPSAPRAPWENPGGQVWAWGPPTATQGSAYWVPAPSGGNLPLRCASAPGRSRVRGCPDGRPATPHLLSSPSLPECLQAPRGQGSTRAGDQRVGAGGGQISSTISPARVFRDQACGFTKWGCQTGKSVPADRDPPTAIRSTCLGAPARLPRPSPSCLPLPLRPRLPRASLAPQPALGSELLPVHVKETLTHAVQAPRPGAKTLLPSGSRPRGGSEDLHRLQLQVPAHLQQPHARRRDAVAEVVELRVAHHRLRTRKALHSGCRATGRPPHSLPRLVTSATTGPAGDGGCSLALSPCPEDATRACWHRVL